MFGQSSEKTWSWFGNKTQTFGSSLDNDACVFQYNQCKKQLEKIFENISEGIRVRSGFKWYEEGEKSRKVFLNKEKLHGLQGKIHKIIVDSKKIASKSFCYHEEFLDKTDIPKLDIGDKDLSVQWQGSIWTWTLHGTSRYGEQQISW